MYLKGIEIQSILNGSYLYILVIFIVLIATLIVALTRNAYKSLRSLGIVSSMAGAVTIAISYGIPMILNIFSDELSSYMGIINPVVNTFMEKLALVGIAELAIGVVLFVISIIVKKTRSEAEAE